MGKKLSQTTSLKISKKEKKREFNSLIRLLRPKVYITDRSSFKRLVQDLTGNGTSSSNSITNSSHPQKHKLVEEIPVVIDIDEDQGDPEGSVDVSTDASVDSSELCNQELMNQGFNQLCYQMYSDDHTTTLEGSSTANHWLDMLSFQDLESWLLDSEPYDPFNNGYAQIFEPDVSIYDYELSGLL